MIVWGQSWRVPGVLARCLLAAALCQSQHHYSCTLPSQLYLPRLYLKGRLFEVRATQAPTSSNRENPRSAMRALPWVGTSHLWHAAGTLGQSRHARPSRPSLRAAAEASPLPPLPPPVPGSGGPSGAAGPPGFLQNPVIAQREMMRQFFMAGSSEEQMRIVAEAGLRLDLSTSLQLLCHLAELSLKGMMPGSREQQGELLSAIHRYLSPALPEAQPLQLATALWSYAAVGAEAAWVEELLQQAAERELAAGPGRVEAYNTKELTSLLFAYGQLARQHNPELLSYCTSLAAELDRRWEKLPYVRASFSSTDFADLAEACAKLYGATPAAACSLAAQAADSPKSSRLQAADVPAVAGAGNTLPAPLPASVATLMDNIASEVRRQLANKHSARSPWTPRDLVRLARAFAALRHRTPRAAQMLDVLSSFCVQRIRSRHLNCVSRPADLARLLEAYADLAHSSVAVPELLTAVSDQVRREAASQADQAAAAAAVAAASVAEAGGVDGGASAVPQVQQAQPPPVMLPAAAAQQVPTAGAPAAAAPPPAQAAAVTTPAAAAGAAVPAGLAADGFSLPLISSLVESHLRLGYQPPVLLLQCLGPQIRSQLPDCPATDASALLQLLAAANCSPGPAVVSLLQAAAQDGEGGSDAAQAAQRAADALLGVSAASDSTEH